MHKIKRTRITQSAPARVAHNQIALIGKASRIFLQSVGMAHAKYFPTLFKDLDLSPTTEEKVKTYNIWLYRELGCQERVTGGGEGQGKDECVSFFPCCYGKTPCQRNVRKEESILVHSLGGS